jgi:hypothetical protein
MCSWIFSATFHLPQTMVNTWVDGYGRSEFNLRQTNVNTWVDGYGCSGIHLQQTMVTRGLTATGVLNYIPTQKPRLFPLVHRYIHTLVHHSAVSASADATRISTSAHNHINTLKNP